MVRSYEEELQHRRDLRKKYFEGPNYRKWSDIVPGGIDGPEYAAWRDDRLFDYLVTGQVTTPSNRLKLQVHLRDGHDLPINWSNFYAYFDEQLNDPENRCIEELTKLDFYDPIHNAHGRFTVQTLLNQYRDHLTNPYDII